jgi:hypothetical protein
MRNILFAFFTLIITNQGYSQTMNSYFNELNLKFSDLGTGFDMVSNNFNDLESKFFDVGMYFDMTGNDFNDLESLSMNMAGHYSSDVSSWWSQIASRFSMIENHLDQEVRSELHDAATRFGMIEYSLKTDIRNDIFEIASIMNQIGNTFGGFDGSFNSLSGTPTTLAGYGITDSGLKYVTEGDNTGVRLSSSNTANHGDIGNTAVDLSFQSSASSTTGATGQSSFAVGLDSTASGTSSISGGYLTIASGDVSVALGNGAQAAGTYSYSIGHLSKANGDNSVALGFFNESNGQYATSFGKSTEASGNSSTSIGDSTTASGQTATAMGENTTASGYVSLALGKNTTSSAEQSIAAGFGSIAEGNRSTALGFYSKASGTSSTALGLHTVSESPSSLVIGTWNELNEGDEWPLFVIGNGGWDASATNYLGGEENRSNAFEVLFDGTTTIAGDLSINSDARLKANIVSLGATLSKLLQIDGKSYTMKKDKREKQKIGLLAQDIEKVFPELVSESNGIKSVNYQGLVPVLINALKEQEEKIKSQENKLLKLESIVQDLVDNQ